MKELLLALEGGGTKTRILLADGEGAVLAREYGGPASPLYTDKAAYAQELRPCLARLKGVAQRVGGRVTRAGLAAPMHRDIVEEAIRAAFGPIEIAHAGESDVALALFGLDWGVSLVAGTGASCRVRTADGALVSRGGFGPQFGDEGSGYWIGREAVAAALRAADGRGPPTLLGDAICDCYSIKRVLDVLEFIDRSGHVPGPRVAALTPAVFAAARQGDAVAKGICRRAGRELGRLVVATTEAAGLAEGPAPVAPTGGVFHGGGLVMTPLKRVLRDSGVPFDVHPAAAEPTEGIVRLLQRDGKRSL